MSFTITICVINIALGEPAPSIWNAFEAHSLNTHIQLEQLNKCGLVPIIWVLLETSWLQSIVDKYNSQHNFIQKFQFIFNFNSAKTYFNYLHDKRPRKSCYCFHEHFSRNWLIHCSFIKKWQEIFTRGGGGLLADSIWSSRNLFPPSGCNQLALKVHRRLVTEQANTHNSKQHTINKLSPERLLCDIFCPFFHYAYFTGYFIKFR